MFSWIISEKRGITMVIRKWKRLKVLYLQPDRVIIVIIVIIIIIFIIIIFLPKVPWTPRELQKLPREVKMFSGMPKPRQDPAVQKNLGKQ